MASRFKKLKKEQVDENAPLIRQQFDETAT
jgi:hypothetical protein